MPVSSVASAVSVTVPLIVAPGAGEVIATVGGPASTMASASTSALERNPAVYPPATIGVPSCRRTAWWLYLVCAIEGSGVKSPVAGSKSSALAWGAEYW
jgi:hypothetical protein